MERPITVDLAILTGAGISAESGLATFRDAGGHRDVVHMHGALDRATCAACHGRWEAPLEMAPRAPCPFCRTPATRPDIVWFGEIPQHMERISDALATATHFAAIGTSGQVYPAAGFVEFSASRGARCWELTLEASGAPEFDVTLGGPATETVPRWCEEIADAL